MKTYKRYSDFDQVLLSKKNFTQYFNLHNGPSDIKKNFTRICLMDDPMIQDTIRVSQ